MIGLYRQSLVVSLSQVGGARRTTCGRALAGVSMVADWLYSIFEGSNLGAVALVLVCVVVWSIVASVVVVVVGVIVAASFPSAFSPSSTPSSATTTATATVVASIVDALWCLLCRSDLVGWPLT